METFEEFYERRKEEMRDQKLDDLCVVQEASDWSEISTAQYPQDPWRIEKILPEGGQVILSSVSGEKKTWVALEMARALVSGTPFIQNNDFKTQGCNVLYIDAESSKSEFQRRGKQLQIPENGSYKFKVVQTDDLNLNDEEKIKWLTILAEYHEAKVVIIDTFRAVSSGLSDDKSVEVREFFNRFKPLKDKGVCVVFLDHFRKPNNLDGKVPKKEHLIGSQDKTATSEVLLMIRSESGTEKIEVFQRKNRLGKEIKPFEILMEDRLDSAGKIVTTLKYNGELDDETTKKDDAKSTIQELLTISPKTTKQLVAVLRGQMTHRFVQEQHLPFAGKRQDKASNTQRHAR
jgi:hypothetical protein